MRIFRISGRQLIGAHALQSKIEIVHVEYIESGSATESNGQVEVLVSEVVRHGTGEFRQTVSGHRLVFFRTLSYTCIAVGVVVSDTLALFNPLQISRIVRIRHVAGRVIFLPLVHIVGEADEFVIIGSSHQCETITEVLGTNSIHRYVKLETSVAECTYICVDSREQVGRNRYGVATQQIALFAVEVVQ